MQALDKTLRRKLERTVVEARDMAEAAARAAVEQLGVGESAPYGYLGEEERELRRKLRVHGRQLGDLLHRANQRQEIDLLVEEIAYEHWHRMIFARFLAENDLLMYPDPDYPVPVSLEECDDLAAEEGAKNGWELAARYAARMLPQIFRTDSPVFQLELPPEHQQRLERLLSELPAEVFLASDSLGWVYQFWQAKKKKEVNASEVKIGARELPAVTQLFTEPYMVSFLLDNSLGAWWAARRLTEDDLRNAGSEEELRAKASLPGVSLEYLRFVKGEDGKWTPAAGTFDDWPEKLADLKTLDPCCGSGHFLVACLLMLVPMRMEMERLSAGDAVDAVLRENIHGLELDQRCVELAAFALALTAWRYPDAGGYRKLHELNLACSGLAVGVARSEWQKLADDNRSLRIALGILHDEFRYAPVLGSLLNPSMSDAAKLVDWNDLAGSLDKALAKERTNEEHEAAVVAHGLARAASLLAGQYNWIITNVPYLKRGKQSDRLKEFCERHHSAAKNDLATVFLDRCLEFCVSGGTCSIVLPQNWLFLTSYRKFREKLLKNDTWYLIARLGEGGFDSSAAAGAFTILLVLGRDQTSLPVLFEQRDQSSGNLITGIDVSAPRTAKEKAEQLVISEIKQVEQAKQLANLDSRILLSESSDFPPLRDYAESSHGQGSFDSPRFTFRYWEIIGFGDGWIRQQSSARETCLYDGCQYAFRWENGRGDLWAMMEAKKRYGYTSGKWMAGTALFGRKGMLVNQMRAMPATLYLGSAFDENASVITPKDAANLLPIVCFCSSEEYVSEIRKIDQKLNVTSGTLVKVPFNLDHWTKVAEEKYPNGLPDPYSDDPTQWIFHGHLAQSNGPLQVAVARLLGYRWPAELDVEMELSHDARVLVRKCDELLNFTDKDGIVCIPPVRGEAAAADRLLNLLATAYGDTWNTDKLSELLKNADHAGKTLDSWLRDKFFIQHCKLFHHRPFIWHIWDGLRDGFAALVNYHKLDRKNLETLIYTYLGDWILRQKDDISSDVDGAEERLAAAEYLKRQLELILQGQEPYDIFVRWKPLEKQPIGWEPDLNDGVRLNIRPFMSVADVRKKGAGVLRDKPNIHWSKDRGKDVASAPWYHLGPEYGGKEADRINEHHLNLDEKRNAREAAK